MTLDDYGTVRVVECRLTRCFNCRGLGCHPSRIWGAQECCICRGTGLVDALRFGWGEDQLDLAARLGVDGGSALDPDETLAPCSTCDGEGEVYHSSGTDWTNGPWEHFVRCPDCHGVGSEVVTAEPLTVEEIYDGF